MVNKILGNKKKLIISLFSIVIIAGIISSAILLMKMEKNNIKPIASIDTGGDTCDVEVINGIAYVSDMMAATLEMINVSDPYHPCSLSSFQTHGIHQLTVRGDIAFLTDYNYGLILVNVSDPIYPVEISTYLYNTGEIYDVWVEDDLMYLVDQYDGLEIVNISNPSSPTWVAEYNYGVQGVKIDVFVKDKMVYLTDFVEGLFVINATNPENPTLCSRLNVPYLSWMDYYRGFLYIPTGKDILIVNITEPQNLEIIKTITIGTFPTVVTIKNGIALVSDDADGVKGCVYVINISEPLNPEIMGQYSRKGSPFGCYIEGDYFYVAFKTEGLFIFKLPTS